MANGHCGDSSWTNRHTKYCNPLCTCQRLKKGHSMLVLLEKETIRCISSRSGSCVYRLCLLYTSMIASVYIGNPLYKQHGTHVLLPPTNNVNVVNHCSGIGGNNELFTVIKVP